MILFILGTAGSGKTTLAKALSKRLEDSVLINLDPGNPLNSDIDIREYVKTEKVMKEYNLGPNSAILRSMELSLNYIDEIVEKSKGKYWKIVDTPGQLEIFLYRDFGRQILEKFSETDETALIFLIDINDLFDPRNFLTIIAWSVIIYLKTEKRSIQVINKIDLIPKEKLTELKIKLKTFRMFEELEKGGCF